MMIGDECSDGISWCAECGVHTITIDLAHFLLYLLLNHALSLQMMNRLREEHSYSCVTMYDQSKLYISL